MDFNEAKKIMFDKLGTHKIMAIGTSVNDYVMIRNVSCIIYDNKIYFKTDKYFVKTKQLLENNYVAMCFHGVSFEGKALNKGAVVNEENLEFQDKYLKYWDKSYTAYSHINSEILIEVTPISAEVWDQKENDAAYQIKIDFINEESVLNEYD